MNPWIDISVTLKNGMVHWPDDQPFHIKRDHDMDQGAANNLSQFTTSAHMGTHMDAFCHFVKGAPAMESFPLDVAIGPARVVHIQDPHEIPVAELEKLNIQAGERVLFKTRNSTTDWPNRPFMEDFVAIPEDSAKFLAERKPAFIGVDYISIGPFSDGGPTHRAILGAGIWVVEGLELSQVEPGNYDLICLPLKLEGSDGSPARAVIRKR